MEYCERRYGLIVHLNKGILVSPWFTAFIQGKWPKFVEAKQKTRVAVDPKVINYLSKPKQRWGAEVDTVYTPMIWGSEHWVGLCISLPDWSILVMDPNPRLTTMEEVKELMEPVATMLPYIVKKISPAAEEGPHELLPFRVERLEGAYVNARSGDCGPVAVKFMEMHATKNENPTMAGLTDELVDIFKAHYAMDIYRGLVVPVYLK